MGEGERQRQKELCYVLCFFFPPRFGHWLRSSFFGVADSVYQFVVVHFVVFFCFPSLSFLFLLLIRIFVFFFSSSSSSSFFFFLLLLFFHLVLGKKRGRKRFFVGPQSIRPIGNGRPARQSAADERDLPLF